MDLPDKQADGLQLAVEQAAHMRRLLNERDEILQAAQEQGALAQERLTLLADRASLFQSMADTDAPRRRR